MEMIHIQDPDTTSFESRKDQQAASEYANFSDDHYLADLLETDLSGVLGYKLDLEFITTLTDEERELMTKLPNREFLLNITEQKFVFFGLFDILCAYLLDWRMNEGGHCIESRWNIARISATLCWFQVSDNHSFYSGYMLGMSETRNLLSNSWYTYFLV